MAMLVYRRVNPHSEHPKFLGLVDVGHLRYQTEIDQAQTAILQQHPAQGMTFFWGKNEGGMGSSTPQQLGKTVR